MTLIPIQVTFRGLHHDPELESDIRERIEWLEQFYDRIVGCRVLVELPHRHHRAGRHFHVRIELTVPRAAPIVVSREPSLHPTLKDAEEQALHKAADVETVRRYAGVAVREAFGVARRQLEEMARERRSIAAQPARIEAAS
jgi:sigma 54 modulation/S30EA-like ribosomal protein